MAEWLYEAGVGENRGALVENGAILEMAIEPDNHAPRAGAILAARLIRRADATGRGLISLADGVEALLAPVPAGLTEGAALRVEIVREAIPEKGRAKSAKARPASTDCGERPGPSLLDRIEATGLPIVHLAPHQPDRLEEHGWSEALEEATTGAIAFPGGALLMALTPAMTLFDVDGGLARDELARAGAKAAAHAIQRFDIGGSIGVDLPTLESKAARQAAAAAFDAALPPPFERTAVNGFGFLQIVRRRIRPSLPELLQGDPIGSAARALLRRAERATGAGARTLVAHPALVARIEAQPDWLTALARSIGAPVALRADPALAISAGHVKTDHP